MASRRHYRETDSPLGRLTIVSSEQATDCRSVVEPIGHTLPLIAVLRHRTVKACGCADGSGRKQLLQLEATRRSKRTIRATRGVSPSFHA